MDLFELISRYIQLEIWTWRCWASRSTSKFGLLLKRAYWWKRLLLGLSSLAWDSHFLRELDAVTWESNTSNAHAAKWSITVRFFHLSLLCARNHHLWHRSSFRGGSIGSPVRLPAGFTPWLHRPRNWHMSRVAILVSKTFGDCFMSLLSDIILLLLLMRTSCLFHHLELIKLLVDGVHIECLCLYWVRQSNRLHIGVRRIFHESWLFRKWIIFMTLVLIVVKPVRYQLFSFGLRTIFGLEFSTWATSADMIWGYWTCIYHVGYASSGRMLDHTVPQFRRLIITGYDLFLDVQWVSGHVRADL